MTATPTTSIEEHTAAGVKLFLRLLKHNVPAICPHLCGGYPSAWTEVTHQRWLEYDLALIDRCTHVLMFGEWANSKGAMAEWKYAIDTGKPVVTSVADLWNVLSVHREFGKP